MLCTPQTTRVCENPPVSEAQDSPNISLYKVECSLVSNLSEGIEDGPGMKEARFRIDRKKLEDMLQVPERMNSGTGGLENAEEFFERIMKETSTQISWPSKLKIGAKSKKDPHVKIVGKIEDVQEAKEKILTVLNTKKNRVTLKMDVSHADHSYIIGKGGFKIQQVMEETSCHIHFPDSNRNSGAEKSNQVSIAGQAENVELARCKIRELLPIVFTLELPGNLRPCAGDEASPAVQHIQQTYSFNVAFRPLGLGKTTLMVVRGCQKHLPRLRQGLVLLMEYLTGSKSTHVVGFMKTEIAPQHHQFVMGVCANNIQMLMAKTGAKITFPDPAVGRLSEVMPGSQVMQSKSTVLIQGTFDSVCFAWQELLKCLPLILMFDLAEGQDVNSVLINQVMESFNISIMIRPKAKENIKSVLVRGAERESKLLFKVRRHILGLQESSSCWDMPPQPAIRNISTAATAVQSAADYQKQHLNSGSGRGGQELSGVVVDNLSILTNLISKNPSLLTTLNSSASGAGGNSTSLLSLLVNLSAHIQSALVNNVQLQNHQQNSQTPDKANPTIRWYSSSGEKLGAESTSINGSLQKSSSDGDSGVYSQERYSCDSRSDLSSQPESTTSSVFADTEQKIPLVRISQDDLVSAAIAEYENKKISATQAMQQPIGEGLRTPTNQWSGYGFSKSMPDFVLKSKFAAQNLASSDESKSDSSPGSACALSWTSNGSSDQFFHSSKNDVFHTEPVSSPFSLSNFWENVPPTPAAMKYNSIKDLDELLSILDLEKYTDLFTHHEIDLSTFLTLSDFDLQQLNISYGARRKMLSAISAIREHRLNNDWSLPSFRAAPGAERRALLSRYSSRSSED